MPSFDNLGQKLLQKLQQPNMLRPQGDDLFFYLVFPSERLLEAKRFTLTLRARLANAGYDLVELSISEVIETALTGHLLWETFLDGEAMDPGDLTAHRTTVEDVLVGEGVLIDAFRSRIEAAKALPQGLVLVTDVEALHPYARMQPIEAQLVNEVTVPVVVMYPGVRSGQYSLRFLGFYDDDPGYRSQFINLTD